MSTPQQLEDIPFDLDDVITGGAAPTDHELLPPATGDALTLIDVLPKDFPLPTLVRFVPNVALKEAVEAAITKAKAINIKVEGEQDGLVALDAAIAEVRAAHNANFAQFTDPCAVADRLHKQLTGLRGQWTLPGETAVKTLASDLMLEKKRRETVAAAQRRAEQDERDRIAKAVAAAEVKDAKEADAPAEVIERLEQRVETAKAAPVAAGWAAPMAPKLASSTTVTTYKPKLKGTAGDALDQQPEIGSLTEAELASVLEAMKAVLAGNTSALRAFNINWSYLAARAKADKNTFDMPGFEVYPDEGYRAKGTRRK